MTENNYSPVCSLPVVIDALLRPLADVPGVVSVHLIDPDGFVVQANGQPAGTDEIERWKGLVQTADIAAMTTLVMEQGYLILAPVSHRTLAVKCQRTTNLGAIRRTIKNIEWPA